jgi:hypothetical protein
MVLQQSVAPHDASKYREPHASVVLRHAEQRPNTAPARYTSCERSHAAAQQLQHARPRTSPQQSCAKPLRTPSGMCTLYLRPFTLLKHVYSPLCCRMGFLLLALQPRVVSRT